MRILTDLERRTGVRRTVILRALLAGYRPRERPDDRFYAAMRQMEGIADGIGRLAAQADVSGGIDPRKLEEEMVRWHRFQAEIERLFLRPEKDPRRWQS